MLIDSNALEFDWDGGNVDKNRKHGIGNPESEEAFFDDNKVVLRDAVHSGWEERFILLGRTKAKRLLFVVFTRRAGKIRIISARPAKKKEATLYEKAS